MRKIKKVYIETTNICNLSCNFCPKTKREHKFMNRQEFAHILSHVKHITDHIYLHIMGEPTLNKNLEYFLADSKAHGLKVNLTTNGTLLHQHGPLLIQSGAIRQINISLHSFEANEITKALEQYLSEVIAFIVEARKSSDMICAIRLWNIDSKELRGCNGLNSEILRYLEEGLQLEFSLAEKLQEKSSVKLREGIYLNMAEKFQWPDREIDEIGEEVFCHGLRNQIGILVDGTVVPCCLDSEGTINLGNVFQSPLSDILSGERAKRIYDGFSNRTAVEELCRKCGYATRF